MIKRPKTRKVTVEHSGRCDMTPAEEVEFIAEHARKLRGDRKMEVTRRGRCMTIRVSDREVLAGVSPTSTPATSPLPSLTGDPEKP